MSYHFTKTVPTSFDETIDKVTAALKEKGFGVLTTIDVKATLKEKLDAEWRPYTILGACNPRFAHQALQIEDKIGTMLPCNVIVQQTDAGVEVSAIDPLASMQAVDSPGLEQVASQVQGLLKEVIAEL